MKKPSYFDLVFNINMEKPLIPRVFQSICLGFPVLFAHVDGFGYLKASFRQDSLYWIEDLTQQLTEPSTVRRHPGHETLDSWGIIGSNRDQEKFIGINGDVLVITVGQIIEVGG